HLYRGANNLAGEIADWPCADGLTRSAQSTSRLEEVVSLQAIKKGDIAGAANVLATVLLQLNLAFNPAKIILAGAMTTFGEDFLNLVQDNLKSMSNSSGVPHVFNSQLGDFNGAIGAAALAVHHWKPARK